MSIFEEQPISKVVWKLASELDPNDYNPNRVLNDEFKILALNIQRFGWIQPILINKNNIIIDGFHRWRLSQDSEELILTAEHLADEAKQIPGTFTLFSKDELKK